MSQGQLWTDEDGTKRKGAEEGWTPPADRRVGRSRSAAPYTWERQEVTSSEEGLSVSLAALGPEEDEDDLEGEEFTWGSRLQGRRPQRTGSLLWARGRWHVMAGGHGGREQLDSHRARKCGGHTKTPCPPAMTTGL